MESGLNPPYGLTTTCHMSSIAGMCREVRWDDMDDCTRKVILDL